MTAHTEYALRCARIAQVLNLPLAIPASKTTRAECLITRKDCQVFDLVAARVAAVGAVVADKRSIAE